MKAIVIVVLILLMLFAFQSAIAEDGFSFEAFDTGLSEYWTIGFMLGLVCTLLIVNDLPLKGEACEGNRTGPC